MQLKYFFSRVPQNASISRDSFGRSKRYRHGEGISLLYNKFRFETYEIYQKLTIDKA